MPFLSAIDVDGARPGPCPILLRQAEMEGVVTQLAERDSEGEIERPAASLLGQAEQLDEAGQFSGPVVDAVLQTDARDRDFKGEERCREPASASASSRSNPP